MDVRRRCVALLVVAVGLAVAPVVVGATRAALDGWAPVGDVAILQVRTFDVGTSRTPLVGMPSTGGDAANDVVFHAGPAQFYLLAVPTRLVSTATDSPTSLLLAQAAVNTVLIGGAILIAWRHRRRLIDVAVAFFVVSPVLWLAGAAVPASPLNPDFALVALGAATAAALATDRSRDVVSASLIVGIAATAAQPHLAYSATAALVGLWVLLDSARRARADRRWSVLAWPVAAGFLVWIPPLVDAFAGRHNASSIFRGGAGERLGVHFSLERMAEALLPWHLGLERGVSSNQLTQDASGLDIAIALALVLAVGAGALRAPGRVRGWSRLAVSSMAAIVVTTAALPTALGSLYAAPIYRSWLVPAVLVWLSLCATIVRLAVDRITDIDLRRPVAIAGFTVGGAVTVVGLAAPMSDVHPFAVCSSAVRQLSPSSRVDVIDSRSVFVDTLGFVAGTAHGIVAEAVRRYGDVRLDTPSDAYHPGRVLPADVPLDPALSVLHLTADPEAVPADAIAVMRASGSETCEEPGGQQSLIVWQTPSGENR